MAEFEKIGLKKLLCLAEESPESISLQRIRDLLSGFSCPFPNDVENFLYSKAIEFERQGIAATHLVITSYQGNMVLAGYFTLALKYIHSETKNSRYRLGSKLRQRLNRFSVYEEALKEKIVPMPLIGQLGKNYANGYDKLISGDELLQLACDTVKESQAILGGRMVYLECEDTPHLIQFYEQNGFVVFNRRELEAKEGRYYKGEYFLQLVKYL